jgi:hypothetical protein
MSVKKTNVRNVASSHPSSKEGQQRRAIYKAVWLQIARAKSSGCWLEVITLVESILADRLEARVAHINHQEAQSRKMCTAAQSAKVLLEHANGEDKDALDIYNHVVDWSNSRNSALHELAKSLEEESRIWSDRYEEARLTAVNGERLAKRISALVKKLNRPRKAEVKNGALR